MISPRKYNLGRIYMWLWNTSWNLHMILTCFKGLRVNWTNSITSWDWYKSSQSYMSSLCGQDNKPFPFLSFLLVYGACVLSKWQNTSFPGRWPMTHSISSSSTVCTELQTPNTGAGSRHSNAQWPTWGQNPCLASLARFTNFFFKLR